MAASPLGRYVSAIERNLMADNATEHTHRPALKALLEQLATHVTATNEPKRVACGAPDFVISENSQHGSLTIGYLEAKDVGEPLDKAERSEQIKRYCAALPNLILTDYLEFRWYVDGTHRQTARVAEWRRGKLIAERDGTEAVAQLLRNFVSRGPQSVTQAHDLAVRMARFTHMVRDIIIAAFENNQASELLQGWRMAFAEVLIADLDRPEKTAEFADMFAQTLAYGLFSARVMDTTTGFTRQEAQRLVPKTNPFLRRFFGEISGVRMDDEPYAGFVDDLVALLEHTDMDAVLADFGNRTRLEDPVVHFYETFLAAYDPALREARGVYYTPEPVVSYIVRSVDHLLKARFDCSDGLVDNSMVKVSNPHPRLKVKGKNETRKTTQSHKVLLLDPACGTGTFLYAVVDQIRSQFMAQGNAGMWPGYVSDHLLPRLFGFELLMAPYAVAHFKLSLQLAGRDLPEDQRAAWAYDFGEGGRVGVYLTNTLDGPHEWTGLPLFTQFLADETEAANRVKQDLPIMIILGNPPYSGHSSNKNPWIRSIVEDYVTPYPDLRKPAQAKWLQDDYVKFIRFAQWRVDRTGRGIVAFVTNHRYLDNPTFRGMRESLMNSFTRIYVLNLHGNRKRHERTPGDKVDENVFDIQQGVAIGLFLKESGKSGPANVYHADLWGTRESKYNELSESSVATTEWTELAPRSPAYLFIPQRKDVLDEYECGWRVTDIMSLNGDPAPGMVTTQDQFAVSWSPEEAAQKVLRFLNTASEEQARAIWRLCSQSQWNYRRAKDELSTGEWRDRLQPILYRPFDTRWTVYDSNVAVHRRDRVMRHMLTGRNIGLCTTRSVEIGRGYEHALCVDSIIGHHTVSLKEINYILPLYLYPEEGGTFTRTDAIEAARRAILARKGADAKRVSGELGEVASLMKRFFPRGEYERWPNLSPYFILDLERHIGLPFVFDTEADLETTFGPEDILHYVYAILYSPSYRSRYGDFLRADFPRVPLTTSVELFRSLVSLGSELVDLHLRRQYGPALCSYPVRGSNIVDRVSYQGRGAGTEHGRVWINKDQFFDGVSPEVWYYSIGGYQVCEKWMKDRKGRMLSFNDLEHYQALVAALSETIRLITAIDQAIDQHGSWPIG